MPEPLRINRHDTTPEIIDKINAMLENHGLRFELDGRADAALFFRLVDDSEDIRDTDGYSGEDQ